MRLKCTIWRTIQTNKILIYYNYSNKINKQQCNEKRLSTWFDDNKLCWFKYVEHKLWFSKFKNSEK
jgi:hypothetical protein